MTTRRNAARLHHTAGQAHLEQLEPRVILSTTPFGVPTLLSTGQDSNPTDVQAGDLNGDGITDFAAVSGSTADNGARAITLLLSRRGAYETKYIQHDGGANLIRMGDLDVDGDLDLVFTADSNTSLRRVYNDGNGNFSGNSQAGTFNDGNYNAFADFELGDLDNDGRLDLVQIAGDRIFVAKGGSSSGFFTFGGITADNFYDYTDVELSDIDGDGSLDITAIEEFFGVDTYLNRGSNLNFDSTSGIFVGDLFGPTSMDSVTLLDTDNDGKTDRIVTTDAAAKGIYLSENDSTAGNYDIDDIDYVETHAGAITSIAADISGDNIDDLIFTTGSSGSVLIHIFAGRDAGQTVRVDIGRTADKAFATDINGDNRTDLVILSGTSLVILPNLGNMTFPADHLTSDINDTSRIDLIAWGDFNGDDILDYAAWATGADTSNRLYIGQGNGRFNRLELSGSGLDAFGSSPINLGMADLDGDGRDDIYAISISNGAVYLNTWHSTATGVTHESDFLVGIGYGSASAVVTTADFDTRFDGDEVAVALDVANVGTSLYVVRLDPTTGNFAEYVDITIPSDVNDITTADFDNDGDLDIAIAHD
ncbi:MAG: VCBS repeat-containing protein, partial [Planctomycetota bacterium]